MICLPLAKSVIDREFFEDYNKMKNYLYSKLHELPFEVGGIFEYYAHTFPIDANRNECALRFLESDCDISIWLDTDQTFQRETLFNLVKHDLPIVAGMYYAKAEPFYPIVFKESPDSDNFSLFNPIIRHPENELFEADMMGMGCVAIKKEVFKKLEYPYFRYSPHPKNSNSPDMEWKYSHKINDVSEDVYFFKQIRQAGIKVIVDPKIQCGHLTKITIDKSLFDSYLATSCMEFEKRHGKEAFQKLWEGQCQAEPLKKQS